RLSSLFPTRRSSDLTPVKGTFAKLGEMLRQTARVTAPDVPATAAANLATIKALFDQASVPCQVVEDIRRTKWEKMCWNVTFNPLDRKSTRLNSSHQI